MPETDGVRPGSERNRPSSTSYRHAVQSSSTADATFADGVSDPRSRMLVDRTACPLRSRPHRRDRPDHRDSHISQSSSGPYRQSSPDKLMRSHRAHEADEKRASANSRPPRLGYSQMPTDRRCAHIARTPMNPDTSVVGPGWRRAVTSCESASTVGRCRHPYACVERISAPGVRRIALAAQGLRPVSPSGRVRCPSPSAGVGASDY